MWTVHKRGVLSNSKLSNTGERPRDKKSWKQYVVLEPDNSKLPTALHRYYTEQLEALAY